MPADSKVYSQALLKRPCWRASWRCVLISANCGASGEHQRCAVLQGAVLRSRRVDRPHADKECCWRVVEPQETSRSRAAVFRPACRTNGGLQVDLAAPVRFESRASAVLRRTCFWRNPCQGLSWVLRQSHPLGCRFAAARELGRRRAQAISANSGEGIARRAFGNRVPISRHRAGFVNSPRRTLWRGPAVTPHFSQASMSRPGLRPDPSDILCQRQCSPGYMDIALRRASTRWRSAARPRSRAFGHGLPGSCIRQSAVGETQFPGVWVG